MFGVAIGRVSTARKPRTATAAKKQKPQGWLVPRVTRAPVIEGPTIEPIRTMPEAEPIEVALYARHESSRSPAQRWPVTFMTEVLGERVSPSQLPPWSRLSGGPVRGMTPPPGPTPCAARPGKSAVG
jgi:hypothetical protein